MSHTPRMVFGFGPFRLDPAAELLEGDGEQVPLSRLAFNILLTLVRNGGRVVERKKLIEAAWGTSYHVEEGSLDFQIHTLRGALGAQYVVTVRGVGYRLAVPVQELAGPHFSVYPLTSAPGIEGFPAWSPDGTQVVLNWNGLQEDRFGLYTKILGQEGLQRLTQADADDFSPAWSPDGTIVSFIRRSRYGAALYQIPSSGGAEQEIASVHRPSGVEVLGRQVDWSPDGKHLALVDKGSPAEPFSLFLLSTEDGTKRRLTFPPMDALGDTDPTWSPNGRWLAFVRTSSVGVKDIHILDLGDDSARPLVAEHTYVSGLSWTPDSTELVFSSRRFGTLRLWRVLASGGEPRPLVAVGENAIHPSVSRRRDRLAYARVFFTTNLWRLALSGPTHEAPNRFTLSSAYDVGPQYSPDGSRVAFASNRSGHFEIWVSESEGARPPRQLTSFPSMSGAGSPRWSPDGQHLVFDCRAEGSAKVYVVGAEGGTPKCLTDGSSEDVVPSWSKTHDWIYFSSNRGGAWEVWRTTPSGGEPVQVTKQGGFAPVESHDGKYIYYAKGRSLPGLWRVPVLGGQEEPLLTEFPGAGFWGYWALVETGIYFLDLAEVTPPNAVLQVGVKFVNLITGVVTQVATIQRLQLVFYAGLAVSPDQRWALYPQLDLGSSNIMVVEGFH